VCVWGRRFVAVMEFIWQRFLSLAELWCHEGWSWLPTRMRFSGGGGLKELPGIRRLLWFCIDGSGPLPC